MQAMQEPMKFKDFRELQRSHRIAERDRLPETTGRNDYIHMDVSSVTPHTPLKITK